MGDRGFRWSDVIAELTRETVARPFHIKEGGLERRSRSPSSCSHSSSRRAVSPSSAVTCCTSASTT
ncbi:hypothetical protein [Cellulomonas sp. KH9]|uniref:DUF6222 family protein n=1 Tax=Cellulomonas sp. KH9 TaxID=1855324 RepID=UPI0035177750